MYLKIWLENKEETVYEKTGVCKDGASERDIREFEAAQDNGCMEYEGKI